MAEALAAKVHKGQFRIGGAPYITHPRNVVNLLKEIGIEDENILNAAWLHDAIEDSDDKAMRETIYREISPKVAEIVEKLTRHGDTHAYENREEYKQRIMSAGYGVQIIKLADFIDNCSNPNISKLPQGMRDRKIKDLPFYTSLAKKVNPEFYAKLKTVKKSL